MSTGTPYLSIVVATRNDDNGGNPPKRLQRFVNTLDEQCRWAGLEAELIVVVWNPLADQPSVRSLLRLPIPAHCIYRFIEVPPEVHQTLQHADLLPLFELVARNVGIRRACGKFVLATNIDVILSNEVVDFIAKCRLQSGRLYRVDAYDIEPNFPLDASLDTQMDYCRAHQLRAHLRSGTFTVDRPSALVTDSDDIVDGRTVRLGSGWHTREGGGASSAYRWASARAQLIATAAAGPFVPDQTVLEVAVESNPYDVESWVEIASFEGTHLVARTRVDGRSRFVIPVDMVAGETVIELRVMEERDSRHSLPPFERRQALHYRVLSAELRAARPGETLFTYAPTGWSSALAGSGLRVTHVEAGVAVETDPRRWSYALEYGPLWAPQSGRYQFDLTTTLLQGGISMAFLDDDRAAWLPARIDSATQGGLRFSADVEVRKGQRFWIVISNHHPDGEGISQFIVHRLKGSLDPAVATVNPAERSDRYVDTYRALCVESRRRIQRWTSSVADWIADGVVSALSHRIRGRVMRDAPEYQALEQVIRESDAQLRELAPLRHFGNLLTLLDRQPPENLHLNGCGNFQLMARQDWDEIRAYPEFEMFPLNIDGLLSVVADAAGIREQLLDMPVYRLDSGSASASDGQTTLNRRIEESITQLDDATSLTLSTYMRWLKRPMIFNNSTWGFAETLLAERSVWPSGAERVGTSPPGHPAFDSFEGFDGWAEPGFERGFYGSNIRDWLYAGTSKKLNERRQIRVGHPPVDEEYFEWIALVTAVAHTRGRFTFAELGAGWGRWMVSAAALCRQRSMAFSLIGVEPERSHFEWLRMVLADNDISAAEYALFLGAVGTHDGELLLAGRDEPQTAYGHRTIEQQQLAEWANIEGFVFRPVASVTLETLFTKHDVIDLVDMDVQGAEGEIVADGIDVLNRKVRMIHIGTHSAAVDGELTTVFDVHRWLKAFSFPCQATVRTPFGIVTFGDGVQTWVNPKWPELHAALVSDRRSCR